MNYLLQWSETRRRLMLELLSTQPQFTANASGLGVSLGALGAPSSTEQVQIDAAWLAAQGLLRTTMAGGYLVCTLTQAGVDLANGLSAMPGIAPRRAH